MINIFGVIGAEVRATDIIKQIQSIEGDSIDVVISSPGGSVFEGMAIYDALKASGKEVNTSILGLGDKPQSNVPLDELAYFQYKRARLSGRRLDACSGSSGSTVP